ncbi:g2174 [Coccomyxa elongata]
MENGTTTMVLTKIPHFREVVVCSFECEHCGNRNNELQFAGTYGETGVRYTLSLPAGDMEARSRQVVKADSAAATVPELEFEIPAGTQRGTITTVEGLLREASDALRALQPQRALHDPDTAAAVAAFLDKLDACVEGTTAFTLVLDDPAGNSYIESSAGADVAASKDPLLKLERYERTPEQTAAIGLLPGPAAAPSGQGAAAAGALPEIAEDDVHHGAAPIGAAAAHRGLARMQGAAESALIQRYAAPEEVVELPSHCSACGSPSTARMYQTHIPFFKEVILMSDSCDVCGFKSSEIKGGGAISERGRLITVHVSELEDLHRDVIKADTATVEIPELDLEVSTGTMGGLISTVEGLVDTISQALKGTQGFHLGDSAAEDQRRTWRSFFAELDACKALEHPWTLIIRDPLANSFVSSACEDPRRDLRMEVVEYERSAEDDEYFGIDHLKATDAAEASRLEKSLKSVPEKESVYADQ